MRRARRARFPSHHCVFRSHLGTDSGVTWARIPLALGHRFRSTWAAIPTHLGTDSGALGQGRQPGLSPGRRQR